MDTTPCAACGDDGGPAIAVTDATAAATAFNDVPSVVQDAVLKKSAFNKQLSIPIKG